MTFVYRSSILGFLNYSNQIIENKQKSTPNNYLYILFLFIIF